MPIENADYFVRVVPFPVPVGGMTMPNDDGTFSVYINADLDKARQILALRHELRHISGGDWWNEKTIREIESI